MAGIVRRDRGGGVAARSDSRADSLRGSIPATRAAGVCRVHATRKVARGAGGLVKGATSR